MSPFAPRKDSGPFAERKATLGDGTGERSRLPRTRPLAAPSVRRGGHVHPARYPGGRRGMPPEGGRVPPRLCPGEGGSARYVRGRSPGGPAPLVRAEPPPARPIEAGRPGDLLVQGGGRG